MYAFFLAQFFCFLVVRELAIESNVLKIVTSFAICSLLSVAIYELVQKRLGRCVMNFFKYDGSRRIS